MSLTPYDDPTAYSERAIIKPLRERPEWTQVIARGSAQKALTQIPGVKQHHGAWVVEPNAVVAAIGRLGRADGVEVVLRGGVEVDPAPPDGSSVCPEGLWVPPAESGLLRDYQVEDVRFFMEIGGGLAALDMGLGKCQTADTIGFFNGENLEAAVVWERYAGSAEAWRFDGEGYWATPTRPLRAVSLNERSGRIETTLVRRLYRQWVTTRVRRVALDDGSRFGVTIPHRLYVGAGGWTNEYRVGDRVCVPARLPEVAFSPTRVPICVAEACAFLLAEGYEHQTGGSYSVVVQVKSKGDLRWLRERWLETAAWAGVKPGACHIREASRFGMWVMRVNATGWAAFLRGCGTRFGSKAAGKRVPLFILQGDLDAVRAFLRTYIDRDGGVVVTRRGTEVSGGLVEVVTASAGMRWDLHALLLRLGIWSRWRRVLKAAGNGTGTKRPYYVGRIGGGALRRFAEEVGFVRQRHRDRLAVVLDRAENANTDGIPVSADILQVMEQRGFSALRLGFETRRTPAWFRRWSPSRRALVSVPTALRAIASGDAARRWEAGLPNYHTRRAIETADGMTARQRFELVDLAERIDRMCSEEVHYARVVAVDEVDYDGWVYDFDVPEHHNYVAGGALMHNTVEGITFCRQHPGPYIIICPAIAKPVWQREVEKWSPDTPVLVAEGLDPTKSTAHWTWPRDGEQVFIVINYELLDYRFSHGERGRRAKLRDAGKHEEADQIVPHPPLWLERFYDAVFRGERVVGRQPAYTAGAIVLDEAHAVKKGRQVRAMGVEALTRAMPGAKRLALTGTPVYNRIVDLHAVLDWLRPGMFGSWYDFACWYASGYRNSFGFRAVDVARGPELRHRMQWVCRRRTRDEVLHTLPPISREVRSVEDEPTAGKMRRLAAKGVRGLKAALRLGSRKKMKAAFELMEGLSERAVVFGYRVNTVREAFNMACGAKVELVEEDEAAVAEGEWLGATGDDDAEGVRESEVMGRARPVRECIAEGQAEGVRESEVIGRALKEEECEDLRRSSTERGSRPRARGSKATVKVAGTSGYFGDGTACFQIDGRIANSKRQRVISEFTQAEVPAVLFATIDCLKEAVSLTAASFVVFMDIDYLPMKMLQAEARFHRYGQNRRVHVIYLCVKDSPDERTAQFVVEKLAHSGEVLGLSKGEADLKAKVGGMLEDKDKSVLAELFARLTAGGGLDVGALDDWADDDAEVLL